MKRLLLLSCALFVITACSEEEQASENSAMPSYGSVAEPEKTDAPMTQDSLYGFENGASKTAEEIEKANSKLMTENMPEPSESMTDENMMEDMKDGMEKTMEEAAEDIAEDIGLENPMEENAAESAEEPVAE